jgi:hypothetical protein
VRNRLGLVSRWGALVRHPGLWFEVFRLLAAIRRRRRPWPSAAYLGWRSQTAYGETLPIPGDDLIAFLAWRRSMRRLAGGLRMVR